MKPMIAIPQMGNSLFRKYMKSKYVQSLALSGAETKWIELDSIPEAVREVLSCDGLLLPGGADIAPSMYGETPSEKCKAPNMARDAAEPSIYEEFLKTGKPIFAVCRGVQLLNVCQGGTLYQDITSAQTFQHSDFKSRASTTHPVTIEKNSRLFDILGSDTADVNSIHHQAVRQVGKNLIVTARSPDGFIEGLELENHPFCIGVQWHPEHMSRRYVAQQRFFNTFVRACQRK